MKNKFFPVVIALLMLCVAFCFTYYTENEPTLLGKAPEITMVSPKGKTLKLSKLRGKLVLIDFWASWCKPCRIENPNLVKLYDKYHSKGLEIISVSLERGNQKAFWIEAIKKDQLSWYNVSNLKFLLKKFVQ